MPLDLIIGAQWGDEGKGRVTDLLAAEADIVARFNGGDNAGHTVTIGEQTFQLHLVPSGILYDHTVAILGPGMVINPATLVEELDRLTALGLDATPTRVRVSPAAHLITAAHRRLDGAEEARRAGRALGTTRRGIGPAYTDRAARRGLRVETMLDPQTFRAELQAHLVFASELLETFYHQEGLDIEAELDACLGYADRLRPYIAEAGAFLEQALADGKLILGEGAQGTLLDVDHGTYPYVTSSHPTTAGALLGLGLGPGHLRRILGVVKAFQTRVGEGPFPTEAEDEMADRLRGTGKQPWDEFGVTTGRPRRCGWLDGVLLRYAQRINGFTALALTKLDILSGIHPLKVCTAYEWEDGSLERLPDGPSHLESFSPRYEELPGWEMDLTAVDRWEGLPAEAQAYVGKVEALAGAPVALISVGPERNQIIRRDG